MNINAAKHKVGNTQNGCVFILMLFLTELSVPQFPTMRELHSNNPPRCCKK